MDICNSANGLDAKEHTKLCEAKNINQAPEFQKWHLICMKSYLAHSHYISFSTMKRASVHPNGYPYIVLIG